MNSGVEWVTALIAFIGCACSALFLIGLLFVETTDTGWRIKALGSRSSRTTAARGAAVSSVRYEMRLTAAAAGRSARR